MDYNREIASLEREDPARYQLVRQLLTNFLNKDLKAIVEVLPAIYVEPQLSNAAFDSIVEQYQRPEFHPGKVRKHLIEFPTMMSDIKD